MKRILSILLAVIVLTACGNNPSAKAQSTTKAAGQEYVEVIYFHGKKRCMTCNAIEKLTKEVLQKHFAQQLKDGKVIFKTVDISTKAGEKIADKYEVTWSSLYINQWKNGKEIRTNMTEFGFANARNSPDEFSAGIKKKIDDSLK